MNHRQQSLFTYLQDDFKLNSKITLNPGLRYELVTPFYERVNLLSNWDPKTNTILKARSGSIYDRALVNLDKNNFGPRFVLASAAQTPGTPGFLNTQQGFPADFTSPEKFNPRLSTVQHYDPNAPWGEVHSWFVSIQQQLPMGIVLDVGYVGNRGDKLITINDINQARPNRIDENLNIEVRRPNLAYSSISGSIANGFSPYNGLQVKVEKRSERGFYFLNSFTWSRAIDNSSQAFDNNNNNGTSFQDVYNIAADKGLSNYERKFNNITSVVYELPIG